MAFRPESREEAITHFHTLLRQHHQSQQSELPSDPTAKSSPSTSTPFQPVLAAAEQIWGQVSHVLEPLLEGDDAARDALKLALLTVFKEDILDAVEEETFLPSSSSSDQLYESIKRRLDLILAFTQLRKIDDKSPFLVLDDLFALLKVSGCQAIFSFLESRSVELKLPLPADQERTLGLSLLRACNVLLSRLNKSQDAVFCGRILAFMGSSFGLGARSGVNLRGDFNVGNGTVFEEGVEDKDVLLAEEEKGKVQVEEKKESEGGDVEMGDGEAKLVGNGGGKVEGKKEPVVIVVDEDEEEEEGVVKDEMEEGETKDEPIPIPARPKAISTPSSHLSLPKKPSTVSASSNKPLSSASSAPPIPAGPATTIIPSPQSNTTTASTTSPSLPPNESLYTTFWSLQSYFADPTTLLSSPSSAITPAPSSSSPSSSLSLFDAFRAKADRVIDVLGKETEKERVLRGGSGSAQSEGTSGKGKGKERAGAEGVGTGKGALNGLDEVFMPKFLTSPGLLRFELADVSFRRQILVQFLILYGLLQAFSPSSSSSSSTPAGGPGKILAQKMAGFGGTMDGQNDAWLTSSRSRVVEELRQTWPDGRSFTDSILAILRRESNWTRWKDHSCYPFEKPALTSTHLAEARAKRRKLESAPAQPPMVHKVGTLALSELWEEHLLNGLEDLENPRPQDTLSSYSTRMKRVDLQAQSRKRAHEKINGPDSPVPKDDPVMLQVAENKASLTFRALRQVRSTNIHAFSTALKDTNRAIHPEGYIGWLMEDEKARREAVAAAREAALAEEEEAAKADRKETPVVGEAAGVDPAFGALSAEAGPAVEGKSTVQADKTAVDVVASELPPTKAEGDVEMAGPALQASSEVVIAEGEESKEMQTV